MTDVRECLGRWWRMTPVFALVIACAASAPAAPILTTGLNGHTFSTITHAGNAPAVGINPTNFAPYSMGAVNYEYRIGITEVTYGQWFNFVRAIAPFVPPNEQNATGFTSNGIVRIGGTYFMTSPANEATQATWRYMARYCNWLHNGARPAGVATAADFATGAYDTSTFGQLPDGTLTDQARRSEGARYWIPSVDEWTKAVYFDPNRHGENQPGYWQHPGGQDTQLISGPPSQGGQTSAGTIFMGNAPRAVGSYVNVSAPWGLFDASGSEAEWLEDLNPSGGSRLFKPSDLLRQASTRCIGRPRSMYSAHQVFVSLQRFQVPGERRSCSWGGDMASQGDDDHAFGTEIQCSQCESDLCSGWGGGGAYAQVQQWPPTGSPLIHAAGPLRVSVPIAQSA